MRMLCGGGTVLLAEVLKREAPDKHIYAFDTFEGMPEPTEKDRMADGGIHYVRGVLNGSSLGLVTAKAAHFKVGRWITFTKGYFQDTVPRIIRGGRTFCFVVIDPDQYEGTRFCLNFFYDKMEKGGAIVLDDYDIPDRDKLDTPGVKIAADEFLTGKPEKPVHLAESMYFILKK